MIEILLPSTIPSSTCNKIYYSAIYTSFDKTSIVPCSLYKHYELVYFLEKVDQFDTDTIYHVLAILAFPTALSGTVAQRRSNIQAKEVLAKHKLVQHQWIALLLPREWSR